MCTSSALDSEKKTEGRLETSLSDASVSRSAYQRDFRGVMAAYVEERSQLPIFPSYHNVLLAQNLSCYVVPCFGDLVAPADLGSHKL